MEDAEDDPQAPRILFMPNEPVGEAEGAAIGLPLYIAAVTATCIMAASGGTLLAAIAAAAGAGAGGAALGAVFARMIAERHPDYIQDQIEGGGLLLWARAETQERGRSREDVSWKNIKPGTSIPTKFRCIRYKRHWILQPKHHMEVWVPVSGRTAMPVFKR